MQTIKLLREIADETLNEFLRKPDSNVMKLIWGAGDRVSDEESVEFDILRPEASPPSLSTAPGIAWFLHEEHDSLVRRLEDAGIIDYTNDIKDAKITVGKAKDDSRDCKMVITTYSPGEMAISSGKLTRSTIPYTY